MAAMTEITHGSVILYSYLWAREYKGGEESGRKARPACVMIILRGQGSLKTTLLFPITSRPSLPGRRAIGIPETEARRARLYTPAWVIVDEFNTDDLETSFAVEDREPLGLFSRKFMARIAAEAAAAIRTGGAQAIPHR
jgi:hypothetical protein